MVLNSTSMLCPKALSLRLLLLFWKWRLASVEEVFKTDKQLAETLPYVLRDENEMD